MATTARCTGSYAVQVIQPLMNSVRTRSAVFKCAMFASPTPAPPPCFLLRQESLSHNATLEWQV